MGGGGGGGRGQIWSLRFRPLLLFVEPFLPAALVVASWLRLQGNVFRFNRKDIIQKEMLGT